MVNEDYKIFLISIIFINHFLGFIFILCYNESKEYFCHLDLGELSNESL